MSAEEMAIAAGVADRLKIQFTKIRRYPMPPRSGIGWLLAGAPTPC